MLQGPAPLGCGDGPGETVCLMNGLNVSRVSRRLPTWRSVERPSPPAVMLQGPAPLGCGDGPGETVCLMNGLNVSL